MRRLLFSLAALLALPAVVGCSAASEDTGSSDSDVTLHPKAGGTVSLTLTAPPVLTVGPDVPNYHYFYGKERTEIVPNPAPSSFPLAHEQSFELTCPNGKGGTLALGAQSTYFTSKEIHCQWGFGGALVDVDLQPRESMVLRAARLELDDVELSDEGGAKVPGTFTVFKGNTVVAKDLPTKTGVDLPPGHYSVVTSFTRPSGQPDLLQQEVDL